MPVKKPLAVIGERFYSISEIAGLLSISTDTARKLFRSRTGVLRLSHRKRPRMRVPESLLRQVMEELGYVSEVNRVASGN